MSVSAMRGFFALDHLPEEQVTPLIRRRIVTGEKEMVVLWRAKAGAHAAPHRHPHEQIFWMLSGKMRFRLGEETRVCGPGEVCVIPGGVAAAPDEGYDRPRVPAVVRGRRGRGHGHHAATGRRRLMGTGHGPRKRRRPPSLRLSILSM